MKGTQRYGAGTGGFHCVCRQVPVSRLSCSPAMHDAAASQPRCCTCVHAHSHSKAEPPTRPFLRLLGLAQKPLPLQSLQGCWICCTMPGPIGRIKTCTPVPWQVSHWVRLPLLLPVPLHLLQGNLRDSDSFLRSSEQAGTQR